MAITCPACNKANQTTAACARCGCDLSSLQAVVAAATAHLGDALSALRSGDWSAALAGAEASWQLCHSTDAARLGFLAASALRQTAEALHWHERSHGEY